MTPATTTSSTTTSTAAVAAATSTTTTTVIMKNLPESAQFVDQCFLPSRVPWRFKPGSHPPSKAEAEVSWNWNPAPTKSEDVVSAEAIQA